MFDILQTFKDVTQKTKTQIKKEIADTKRQLFYYENLTVGRQVPRREPLSKRALDYTKETQIFLNRIKYHPNCNVLDNNIHDLISASEATICINSGVGIEALLHLKPVFTIGESDYSSATTVIKSKNELSFHMRAKIKKLDVNFIKQFLYFFFNIHLYKNDDSIRILSAIKKAQNDIKKL